jgi:hypothetical protein
MAPEKRIEITEDMMERFFGEIFPGEVSDFSAHKGLPYGLVYNLVHGRINSLSAADYRRIFGEEPPQQEQDRVNGEYFRSLVRLWLFLNEQITEKDLHVEFYEGRRSARKPDYRIFTGTTKTVEKRLERIMEEKFLDQGLSGAEIQKWIKDLDRYPAGERIPFERVRPILARLEKTLQVHPSRLLNRWITSYESGELKTISGELFEKLKAIDRKAEEATRRPSRAEFEKLREEVYGSREGFTLFSEIEEELEFLKLWGRRSPKKYLGRSAGKYRRSKLKRVANWRAEKILEDCKKLIAAKPDLSVSALPKRYRIARWKRLTIALEQAVVAKMFSKDKLSFEKRVLKPVYHTKEEYESEGRAFVSPEEAARILRMSEKGFGLLMGAHCEIFRKIGRYKGNWTIPDLYLFEVAGANEFPLIRAKYEWLARKTLRLYFTADKCLGADKAESPKSESRTVSAGGGAAHYASSPQDSQFGYPSTDP